MNEWRNVYVGKMRPTQSRAVSRQQLSSKPVTFPPSPPCKSARAVTKHHPTISSRTMSSRAASSATEAKEFISHSRFHQLVTISATGKHNAIALSYADFGRQPEVGSPVPTILFIPGMFGSRLCVAHMHPLAEKYGVRVLTVDRYVMAVAYSLCHAH